MSDHVRTFTASTRDIIVLIATVCCLVSTGLVVFRTTVESSPSHVVAPATAVGTPVATAAPQHAFATTATIPTGTSSEYPLLGEPDSIQVLCSDTGNAMVRILASTGDTSHVKIAVTIPDIQPQYTIVLFDSIASKDDVLHLTEPVPMDSDIVISLTINPVTSSPGDMASGFSGSKLFRTPYC